MPYSRRYKKSEGPFQKRARVYGGAGRLAARDISTVAKQVAYLGSLVNSEPKYHLVTSNANFSWTGNVVDLSAIPTGDQNVNRDGTSILPRYLHINMRIKKAVALPVVSSIDHGTYRLLIFRWWGGDANVAAVPTPAEILTTIGSQNSPQSFLDDDITGAKGDRTRRIEVLKSDLVTLDITGNANKDYNLNLQMNGPNVQNKSHIKYVSNATAPATSGGLYLLIISDLDPGVHVNQMACNFLSKLTFYDN